MPLTAAAGTVSSAEEALGRTLAACTAFQGDGGDETSARQRIFYHALPPPANDGEYTAAELAAYRPCALIYTDFPRGYRWHKVGSFAWDDSGRLALELEWTVPEAVATDEAEVARRFSNWLGTVMQLRANEADEQRGLIDLFDLAPYADHQFLAGAQIDVVDVTRTAIEQVEKIGDCIRALLIVHWGSR